VKSRSEKISLGLSIGMHLALGLVLFCSFERSIVVPMESASSEPQEIIEATVVNDKALRQEISRLAEKEAQKKAKEEARLEAIANQAREAKEKRQHEEQLVLELQKKNEQLKIETEQKRLALQQEEAAREKKLKAQQEELAKIQKEKEAVLAAKKKAAEEEKKALEQERKTAELEKRAREAAERKQSDENEYRQANVKLNHDEITRHAQIIRQKIHQNWRQPLGLDITGFTCKVAVKLLPTGEVIDAQVIQSSGSIEFDRSTELAIRKSSPLPMPNNGDVAREFRQFTFTFRPEAA
jgi:colicin import membrane protein